MLQKLTDLNRQGKVNDGFLRDFHVFMEELRDFFGAASLGRLLEQCKPALDVRGHGFIMVLVFILFLTCPYLRFLFLWF